MRKLRIGGLAAAVLALCAGAQTASAAPVVRQDSGDSVLSITDTVDQFRNDLGTNNGGGPPAASGRRQIGWDGVPDVRSAPSFMPEGQFRGVGALFSTPGLGFEVSGDDNAADGVPDDPDLLDFNDLNATYAADFAPFSPVRLFTPVGSNVTDTTFVVPGTDTEAQTNGFGVVFSDVDVAGPTKLELFAADGSSLGSFPVPAGTTPSESFSFLGVVFDAGERVALARITTGAAAPGGNDVTQGGAADIVVMDDFIFGEPQAVPPPPPVTPPAADTQRPTVTLRGAPRSIRLRGLLRNGLRLRLTPNEAASFRVSLLGSVRNVRIARNELALASRTLGRATGERTLRLRPKRRLLKNAPRRFRVQLVVQATDASSNTQTVRRTIRVRR
jgi:hypothetical protein